MKITIEFNLPDEEWDYLMATNAPALGATLGDLYRWLRAARKHGIPDHIKTPLDVVEELWEQLHACTASLPERIQPV